MRTAQNVPLWQQLKAVRPSADRLLDFFGVQNPPVPVEAIAREMGVVVRQSYDTRYSGSVDSRFNPPVIEVSALEWPREFRRRFTIAHELGHLILHPVGKEWRDVASFGGDIHEAQANGYAAALLMPFWMLDPYASRFRGNVVRLAEIFKVSEPAMAIRLRKMAGG